MIRLGLLLLVVIAVAGCQNGRWGPYVSPRISGQVLAADSHKPLPDVVIIRNNHEPTPKASSLKGGEQLMRKLPIRTDANGEFVLESERVLSIFRGAGWSQVQLRLQKPGYITVETNYPVSLATNEPAGEATLALGQILLEPVAH